MHIPRPALVAAALTTAVVSLSFLGAPLRISEEPQDRSRTSEGELHVFLSEPIRRLSESTRRDYVKLEQVSDMLNDLERRGYALEEILTVSEGYPNQGGEVGGATVPRVLVVARK